MSICVCRNLAFRWFEGEHPRQMESFLIHKKTHLDSLQVLICGQNTIGAQYQWCDNSHQYLFVFSFDVCLSQQYLQEVRLKPFHIAYTCSKLEMNKVKGGVSSVCNLIG